MNDVVITPDGLMQFFAPPSDVEAMDILELRSASMYTCLRGPRPSAALLRFNTHSRFFVMGFVEPPQGSESCEEVGMCMIEDGHCVRNNHAEVDAIIRSAKVGRRTDQAVCYSINKPCYQCTRALIAAGVKKIYYRYAVYDEDRTRLALEAANVQIEQI